MRLGSIQFFICFLFDKSYFNYIIVYIYWVILVTLKSQYCNDFHFAYLILTKSFTYHKNCNVVAVITCFNVFSICPACLKNKLTKPFLGLNSWKILWVFFVVSWIIWCANVFNLNSLKSCTNSTNFIATSKWYFAGSSDEIFLCIMGKVDANLLL